MTTPLDKEIEVINQGKITQGYDTGKQTVRVIFDKDVWIKYQNEEVKIQQEQPYEIEIAPDILINVWTDSTSQKEVNIYQKLKSLNNQNELKSGEVLIELTKNNEIVLQTPDDGVETPKDFVAAPSQLEILKMSVQIEDIDEVKDKDSEIDGEDLDIVPSSLAYQYVNQYHKTIPNSQENKPSFHIGQKRGSSDDVIENESQKKSNGENINYKDEANQNQSSNKQSINNTTHNQTFDSNIGPGGMIYETPVSNVYSEMFRVFDIWQNGYVKVEEVQYVVGSRVDIQTINEAVLDEKVDNINALDMDQFVNILLRIDQKALMNQPSFTLAKSSTVVLNRQNQDQKIDQNRDANQEGQDHQQSKSFINTQQTVSKKNTDQSQELLISPSRDVEQPFASTQQPLLTPQQTPKQSSNGDDKLYIGDTMVDGSVQKLPHINSMISLNNSMTGGSHMQNMSSMLTLNSRKSNKLKPSFISKAGVYFLPDPNIISLIKVIAHVKRKCEAQQNYILANQLKMVSENWKNQEQQRQMNNMIAAQQKEIQGIEKQQDHQYEEFKFAWDKYMYEYEKKAMELVQNMKDGQAKEVELIKTDVPEKFYHKLKWSKQIVELEKKKQVLNTCQKYEDAQKVKNQIEVLKTHEVSDLQDALKEKIKKETELLNHKHALKLQGLVRRIQRDRDEQIKNCQGDSFRLIQRNKNIVKDIMDKQGQERRRTILYMNFALGKREEKSSQDVSQNAKFPSNKSSFSSNQMPKLFRRHKGSTSKSSIQHESGLKLYDSQTERLVQQKYNPKISLKSLQVSQRNSMGVSPIESRINSPVDKNSPRLSLDKIEIDTERSWQKYQTKKSRYSVPAVKPKSKHTGELKPAKGMFETMVSPNSTQRSVLQNMRQESIESLEQRKFVEMQKMTAASPYDLSSIMFNETRSRQFKNEWNSSATIELPRIRRVQNTLN